jgi:hypothetical protein
VLKNIARQGGRRQGRRAASRGRPRVLTGRVESRQTPPGARHQGAHSCSLSEWSSAGGGRQRGTTLQHLFAAATTITVLTVTQTGAGSRQPTAWDDRVGPAQVRDRGSRRDSTSRRDSDTRVLRGEIAHTSIRIGRAVPCIAAARLPSRATIWQWLSGPPAAGRMSVWTHGEDIAHIARRPRELPVAAWSRPYAAQAALIAQQPKHRFPMLRDLGTPARARATSFIRVVRCQPLHAGRARNVRSRREAVIARTIPPFVTVVSVAGAPGVGKRDHDLVLLVAARPVLPHIWRIRSVPGTWWSGEGPKGPSAERWRRSWRSVTVSSLSANLFWCVSDERPPLLASVDVFVHPYRRGRVSTSKASGSCFSKRLGRASRVIGGPGRAGLSVPEAVETASTGQLCRR